MSLDVASILSGSGKKGSSESGPLPSASVERPLDPEVLDAGQLLIVDANELPKPKKGATALSEEQGRTNSNSRLLQLN